MKTSYKIAAVVTMLSLFVVNSRAQTLSRPPGDTTNIILYNNDLNFDQKRSVTFTDKHSVDSLVNVLVTTDNKRYRIVYRREGKEGILISRKELNKLDRTGVYRVMIAYNKKGLPEDGMPIYILTSK